MPIAPKCPICGRSRSENVAPFCSARCAQIDLGRWFSGSYTVQTEEKPDEPKEEDGTA